MVQASPSCFLQQGMGSSTCTNIFLPLQELTLQMNLLELIRKLQQKEAEAEKKFS